MCYSGVEMWPSWHRVLHQLPAGPNLWFRDDPRAREVNKLSQFCVIDKRAHSHRNRQPLMVFLPSPSSPFPPFSFLSLDSCISPFFHTGGGRNPCVRLLCIIPHAKPWRNYLCYLLTLPPVLNWRQWCGRGVYPPVLSLSPLPFMLYPPLSLFLSSSLFHSTSASSSC